MKRDPLPVFSGILTFCRAPQVDRADLRPGLAVTAGVAFDHTCTGRIGARFGPRAIRETSRYFGYHVQAGGDDDMIEVSTGQVISFPETPRLVDVGDLNIYPSDVPRTEAAVEEGAAELAASGALPIILGGDEYVTLPVLRGLARAWTGRGATGVGYVQVSGHLALGDEHPAFDKAWGGATARRIIESGIVEPAHMAWLGIHGRCRGEEWDVVQERDLWIRPLGALRREGPLASAEAALERAGAGGGPVLLSLDMSVLDGVFGSGTSEPSFEGLTNTELLMLVDALARSPIEALVLTGVNPRIESTWTTERLAVVAILRFLAPRVLPPREAAQPTIAAGGRSL